VDDLADAVVHLLRLENPPNWVNVGTGEDITILDLAHLVAKTVGYGGRIETNPAMPDGTPRKLTSVDALHSTGWHHKIDLADGIESTYQSYLDHIAQDELRAV
jgi:GDP-L-fucose synthase